LKTPDADGDLSKITKWSQGLVSASSDLDDTDDNVREADSAGGALRNPNGDAVVQQDHPTADDTSTRDAQSFLEMSKIKTPETHRDRFKITTWSEGFSSMERPQKEKRKRGDKMEKLEKRSETPRPLKSAQRLPVRGEAGAEKRSETPRPRRDLQGEIEREGEKRKRKVETTDVTEDEEKTSRTMS